MTGTTCEGAGCDSARCDAATGDGSVCARATGFCAALLTAVVVSVVSGFSRTVAAQDVAGDLDPRIVKLVGTVSEERLGAILKKLESFETRSSLSSTTSTTRGIGAARQWILTEMSSYNPHLKVSFDTYQVPPQGRVTRNVEMRNVMAILPGRSLRRIYVSGHYDTVARPGGQGAANAGGAPRDPDAPAAAPADPNAPLDNLAPGVNDDGSGTALTMELARIFSQSGIDFDATLVFMCHVGEEQGLLGARLHAQKARVNAAAAATLALAPPPPSVLGDRNQPLISRAPSGYDANLKWNAVQGAAAYRIFWREAWGPDWQHELLVGNVTNLVLPNMQIDDYVFGVAAVDPGGHESFVTAYVTPPRANTPVRTGQPN